MTSIMTNIPRLPFIAALFAVAIAAAPLPGYATSATQPAQEAQAAPVERAADATSDPVTTGSVIPEPPTRQKRIDDCMAIWEPATHMTKSQWMRTCKSQLDNN